MLGISIRRSRWRRPVIALALVLVAALVVVGAVRIFTRPHTVVATRVQANSQPTSCATSYPGKPEPPCSYSPPPPPPSASVLCTSDGLTVKAEWPGAYHGFTDEVLELVNTTAAPCYLAGAPATEVTTNSGVSESVSLGGFATTRVDVQAGEDLLIAFGSPGTCANVSTFDRASKAALALPGGTMDATGFSLDVECGQPEMQMFAVAPNPMS
jgi:hypothetical protein